MPTPLATALPAGPGNRRGDLLLYLALAYAVSWACWFTAIGLGGSATTAPTALPYLLGAFGPLAAALVVRVRRARRGERAPEHAVRFHPRTLLWALLLLLLTSATVLAAALPAHAAGGPALSVRTAKDVVGSAGGPVAFLVGMVVSGPLSEEPGWRGTAWPRMRATMGRFRTGLVLGVIWAVWHLPLFFVTGTVQHSLGLATPSGVLFAVSVIPMAMLTGYAYERGGVVTSMAVHFAANTTMVLLNVHAPVTQAMIIGVQSIVAVVLLSATRSARRPLPDEAPAPATRAPRVDGAVHA